MHGADLRIVFIGPCIAKKGEAARTSGAGRGRRRADLRRTARHARGQAAWIPPRSRPAGLRAAAASLGALFACQPGHAPGGGHERGPGHGRRGHRRRAPGLPRSHARVRDRRHGGRGCWTSCAATAASWAPGISTDEPLFRRRARVSRYVSGRQRRERSGGRGGGFMDRLADLDSAPASRPTTGACGEPGRERNPVRSWPGWASSPPTTN